MDGCSPSSRPSPQGEGESNAVQGNIPAPGTYSNRVEEPNALAIIPSPEGEGQGEGEPQSNI